MNFTSTPPTEPGSYFVKFTENDDFPLVASVYRASATELWAAIAVHGQPVSTFKGYWSEPLELVKPKCSVEGFRTGCGHWFEYMAKDSLLYCPFCGGERV